MIAEKPFPPSSQPFPFSYQLRYLILSSFSLRGKSLHLPPGKTLILSEFVKPLAVKNDLETTLYPGSDTFPWLERYQLLHEALTWGLGNAMNRKKEAKVWGCRRFLGQIRLSLGGLIRNKWDLPVTWEEPLYPSKVPYHTSLHAVCHTVGTDWRRRNLGWVLGRILYSKGG